MTDAAGGKSFPDNAWHRDPDCHRVDPGLGDGRVDRLDVADMTPDYGQQAQRAAEHRLAYCAMLLFDEEHEAEPHEVDEPCGPYCGCDTCIVREVLDAAWPHLMEAAKQELRFAAGTKEPA